MDNTCICAVDDLLKADLDRDAHALLRRPVRQPAARPRVAEIAALARLCRGGRARTSCTPPTTRPRATCCSPPGGWRCRRWSGWAARCIDDVAVPRSRIAAFLDGCDAIARRARPGHRRRRARRRRQHAPDRSCFDPADADQRDRAFAAFDDILELGPLPRRHDHRRARRRRDQGRLAGARDRPGVAGGAPGDQGRARPGRPAQPRQGVPAGRAGRATSPRSASWAAADLPAPAAGDTLAACRAAGRHRRGRRGHVGRGAGPPAARRRRPGDRRPRAGARTSPTPPAASRTGSATWSSDRDELIARTPARVRRPGHRRPDRHPRRGASTWTPASRRRRAGERARLRLPRRRHRRHADAPAVPGLDADGVHGVHRLADGADIRAADRGRARSGPSSSAVATSAWRWPRCCRPAGWTVTVVLADPLPMAQLDDDMGERVCKAMGDMGIDVQTDQPVREIEVDADGVVRAVRTDAGSYERRPRRPRAGHGPGGRRSPREAGLRSASPARSTSTAPSAAARTPRSSPPATARRPSTGSPARPCTSRSARTPTSRAGSPAR